MVELLIANGAKVNQKDRCMNTPIMMCHKYKIVEILVANGADVNAANRDQQTVLMSLININSPVSERIKIMDYLIKNGANINAIGRQDTILDTAIDLHYPQEIIDFLRKHGAKRARELENVSDR